jgi:riboflavin kinase/FMN adenylyltransferase
VVTIGSFDGIHIGHRKLIQRLVSEAHQRGTESVLITFDPHPRSVLFPKEAPVQLLQTLEEKIPMLSKLGLDHLVVVPFTKAFSEMSAEEYVSHFLVNHFHPDVLIIGHDHHFGKNRSGSLQTLLDLQSVYHFSVQEIPAEEINQIAVSSSKIRQALNVGDVTTANHYLCEPFRLSGRVVRGQQLGRQLGYPTANIEIEQTDKLIPGEGVYAVEIFRKNRCLQGMLGIGRRPTLGDDLKRSIEVNIFQFDEDIYGEIITLVFRNWIRADQKFNSLEDLKAALAQDKEHAIQFFQNELIASN